MLNENYANAIFALATISMLLATIKHSEFISDHFQLAELFYYGFHLSLIITSLFFNICLGIFSLFILGNLCDFIQRMSVGLIGARQKLTVLSFLMFISFLFFTASSLLCLWHRPTLYGVHRTLATSGLCVSLLQLGHLFSIGLVHPDPFRMKWMGEVRGYDREGKGVVYI